MTSYFSHSTAVVDSGASIGAATKIWHFCHVMDGARIGRACTLGQNVFVASGAVIGDHVKIQNNVSVYDGVVLEDYTFCGPSAVFTNVKVPRAAFPRAGNDSYDQTVVRHGASIGANATIVCGTTVGRWAFVGAGAVVTRDIPDYGIVSGVPARLVGWMCECGARLEFGRSGATCDQCGAVYSKTGPELIAREEG